MRLSWFSTLGKRPSRRPTGKPWQRRLTLEVLEDRVVPSLSWSSGVALPSPQSGAAAILTTGPSVLVLGGGTTTVNRLAIGSTAWSAVNTIDASRVSPGVGSIGGTEVLVYGGSTDEGALSSALVYDPVNPSNIVSTASMTTSRSLMAYATDGSSRPYAIGGIDSDGTRLASAERFDPVTLTWTRVAALPQARSGAAAVYDGAGHILVFGGATSTSAATTSVLAYTVATNTWSTLAALPTAITEAAAVLGPGGLVYVLGGRGSSSTLSRVQVYNLTTRTWSTATSLPSAVSDETAVVDGLARIEVIGGKNSAGSAVATVSVTLSLANVAPQITTTALPAVTAGGTYDAEVTAFGAPAPKFALVSGPTGLSINSTTGVITWTPSTAQIGTHTVVVQASNVAGTVMQSFTITVTPDTTPPSIPFLSVGTITTTSSIPLNWTASTDNAAVAGYRLYIFTPAVYKGHSGRGGGITLVSPAKYTLLADNITTTSYTVTGLLPNSTHQYAVAAFDAAGNQSGYSNIVTGTTLLAPSITYSSNGVNTNPPLSIVANHQLYLTLWAGGNPAPTLSMLSAPSGVVFTPGVWTNSQLTIVIPNITWTPTASQVGVSDIIMQATNSVGSFILDISVTVTADVPVPSLTVNGGLAYTLGNMTTTAGNSLAYQLVLNPGFDITGGTHPQYALSGTPFSFQITGISNTSPTTYALVSGPARLTLDPSTGIGIWAPGASDASAQTSVTVSATNSAGTSFLTFTFPTYFTTSPGNVAVNFLTPASGAAPSAMTPVVSWTPPANAAGVADYKITVTNANTQVPTVYDTQSSATSFALPAGIVGQSFVTVTAYDANGAPSQISGPGSLYLLALSSVSWTFSTPTAVAGQPLSVQFSSNYVTYAIASSPAGATIDPTSGLLSWTPTLADVGTATIVVTATSNNGWGAIYAKLSFPVYFTDAPTALTVTSSIDSASNVTTWTASWNAPTQNTSNIAGYQITFTDASAPAGTPPTVFTVPATSLSVVISSLATLHGSIQVVAFDAAGDLGMPSSWFTF